MHHQQSAEQSAADATLASTIETISSFLLEQGGTLAQVYGIEPAQLEAAYALAYQYYHQARWQEALTVFEFLCQHQHVERRYQLGRAACLKMLKRHEQALHAYGLAHLMQANDPHSAMHIAQCLLALERRADAVTALESVCALCQGSDLEHTLGRQAAAMLRLLSATEETVCPQ